MQAVKSFRSTAASDKPQEAEAARYGLALALTASGQIAEADTIVDALLENKPHKIAYIIAKAETLTASQQIQQALLLIEKNLSLNPDNHPLTVSYAQTQLQAGNPPAAAKILKEHVSHHPDNPDLWYMLAETYGLAGDIIGVHQARAEFFILNGILDQAQKQLYYALDLIKDDYHKSARIQARIRDIEVMKKRLDF
jgi:predicted Zn-dependent protease